MKVSDTDRIILLEIARNAILSGLENGQPSDTLQHAVPESLEVKRATFVTLTLCSELRGCIGILEARDRIVDSVANNAYAAAFEDPRFPPITPAEFNQLGIEISILGIPEVIVCETEAALLNEMESNRCGWILQEHDKRATFLPSVWSTLGNAEEFLQNLKLKAGLPQDYWSELIQFSRYTTTTFAAPMTDIPAQCQR